MAQEKKSTRGVVDFIFLIDGTGSMGPCMSALKSNIGVFIDNLTKDAQSPISDWRGKVVCYRDTRADGSAWFEDNPFVRKDADALKAQLQKLEPFGGDDEPESLLDALYLVSTMEATPAGEVDPRKWRFRRDAARVVIVFTDATYHPVMTIKNAAGGTFKDVAHQITSQRIVLILYAPDHECYEEFGQIQHGEFEAIPGPNFVEGLAAYTSNTKNFQAALIALAKTVSASAEIPLL